MTRTDFFILALSLGIFPGCVSYEQRPLHAIDILDRLDEVEFEVAVTPGADAPGAGPSELSAFAIRNNPRLAGARAEAGIQNALLVEAGLLPDPTIGWDAMDVVASRIDEGSSGPVDVIAGFGVQVPLLRPGERGARMGNARWLLEESRRRIAAEEWRLVREVHLAYEEVRAAEQLLTGIREITELAGSTAESFRRARDAGAATSIQANLAESDLQTILLDGIRAEGRATRARQRLNALLGLPPAAEVELGASRDPSADTSIGCSVEELVIFAAAHRPDLSVLLASYRAAEEGLRLAVSGQYPRVTIGTGISLELPLFSRWGRPAIETALRRRERLEAEFIRALHDLRDEIATAHASWEEARQEADLVERSLLPSAEENLSLMREAFRMGEVTVLETLALQRRVVEARTQFIEARATRSKRAWALLSASGRLLSEPSSGDKP
jgi:cobalt-zinc-cadmium efflux system outer membrane protein